MDAYLMRLRRGDAGRAFLKIMRGFELTQANRTSTSLSCETASHC